MPVMQSPGSSCQLPVVPSPYKKGRIFCILVSGQSWVIHAAPSKQSRWRNQQLDTLNSPNYFAKDWHKLISMSIVTKSTTIPTLKDDSKCLRRKKSWKAINY